jgi:transcriptional regulator with XRE-family HTH domain
VPLDQKQTAQLLHLGENIRRVRKRQGLTQEKLAELVELNPRTIQKIEAGQVNVLITTIFRIQKALRCSWQRLFDKA